MAVQSALGIGALLISSSVISSGSKFSRGDYQFADVDVFCTWEAAPAVGLYKLDAVC
jgi:hypothetical protein